MTRDLDWGVKVPLPTAEGKVLYVWLDAPIGYISATKQWALDNGKNWKDYWCKNEAGDRKLVHFIGKDNIVFHAIIFPILLKDHGDFILPDNVPAYEFLNLEGDKFSTSRNWAVWLHEFIQAHPNRIDELKYVLTAIAPESKDSEFTWKEFQTRVNSELADILGNFVNRTLVLTHKYYQGVIPNPGSYSKEDEELINEIESTPSRVEKLIYAYKLREAQSEWMNLARIGNKYLADQEPWKLIKTDPERVKTILYLSNILTTQLTLIGRPFLPGTSDRLCQMLNINIAQATWDVKPSSLLVGGHLIGTPEILFTKIDDSLVEDERTKLSKNNVITSKFPPMKDSISFDEFTKMDMRLATIVHAEKVEKADKLLKLIVKTGIDERTIVSGIAENYSPDEIIGKTVLVLLNLEPRKIRGIESQGMVLMAENEEGTLSFLSPEKAFDAGPIVR
jgi:methionyl-tRNA synthetase